MRGDLSRGIAFLWLPEKTWRGLVIFIKLCFSRSLGKLFVSDLIGKTPGQGLTNNKKLKYKIIKSLTNNKKLK